LWQFLWRVGLITDSCWGNFCCMLDYVVCCRSPPSSMYSTVHVILVACTRTGNFELTCTVSIFLWLVVLFLWHVVLIFATFFKNSSGLYCTVCMSILTKCTDESNHFCGLYIFLLFIQYKKLRENPFIKIHS